MEIKLQRDTHFAQWEEFFSLEKLSLWSYSRLFQKQCGLRKREDLSFAVLDGSRVVGICPLYLSEEGGVRSFSDDGGFLRAPLVSDALPRKTRLKVFAFMMDHIDREASAHRIQKALFLIDPQPSSGPVSNALSEFGYLEASGATQVIDLAKPLEELKANLRKSYHSLINKGLRTYDFQVMDGRNPNEELHELYRKTLNRAAGREVRPKATFDLLFEMVKTHQATLIVARKDGQAVQLDYFQHQGGYVYYSSAADEPSFSETAEVPVGHPLLWTAMLHFKENGFKYFEMGWQDTAQIFSEVSPKDAAIAFFKRGFGGTSYPLFKGIKYFDAALGRQEIPEAVSRYLKLQSGKRSP